MSELTALPDEFVDTTGRRRKPRRAKSDPPIEDYIGPDQAPTSRSIWAGAVLIVASLAGIVYRIYTTLG